MHKGGRLFARQPEGGLKGLESGQLLEIVAGAYGLNDAPAHWRRSLKKALMQLGYEQSVLDPTLFLLKKQRRVAGVVIVEVDDLWTAGNADHYQQISALRERFTFGKFKFLQDEIEGVGFNRRRMKQDEAFNFTYDLHKFIEERLAPVEIEGKLGEQSATAHEVAQARAVLGSLNWLGREGRPDLVGEVSILSSRVPDLRVKELRDINRTVERAKATATLSITIKGISEESIGFGVVSDASYANGKPLIATLLYWKSGRIHRVVNSTLAAESMSLSRALGDLMWCVTLFNELTHVGFELKEWESSLQHRRLCVIPGKQEDSRNLAVVDAKSLYDHLSKETCGHTSDQRTAAEMQIIRQTLSELGASIRWVDHNRMLVDALTKMGGNVEPLLQVLRSGQWRIVAEAQEVEHRRMLKAQGALVRHKHSASQNALPGKDSSLAAGNLSWDPLRAMHEENGSSKVSPKEWMNGCVPGLAAQRDAARATKTSPAATSAVQRLRQRREAKATAAAKAAQQAVQPPAEEEPQVDESWIDAMERREAKEKEAKERAAAQRRERKHAARARRSRNGHEGAAEDCDQIDHTERDSTQVAGESESAQAGEDEGEMTNLQDELLVCEDGEDSGEMTNPQDQLLLSEDRKFIDDEVDASSQASDGWIKSSNQKVRNTRRRGDIQGEQEPAAEPDPQHEECNAPEPDGQKQSDTEKIEPQTAPDAPSGLSKRQRQRLRQRQAVEDARASGRKTDQRVEVCSKKMEKAGVEASPHSVADEATASAAPPTSAEEAQETIAAEAEAPVQKGNESKEDGSQGLVPSFADIVAGRPPRPPGEEPRELQASAALQFAADAPDFVPLAAMSEMPFQVMTASAYSALWAQAGLASSTRKARRGRKARREGDDLQALPLTTVVISEIPETYTAESFRLLLDGWGLGYNFFYMPPERQEEYGQCAIVNFVDPSCVMVCQCVFQAASEGIVSLFPIQGLENNVAYWTQAVLTEDMVNGPLVFPGAAAHWSFDSASLLNSKFSPQIREQFHKTKLCVFNRNQKCSMGALCPFAHSEEELQKAPDLKKTKLCYNFFRRKCNDANCKFAHGYAELRATDTVFKTELCRWWANGSCKAGASCRYAHGLKELRSNPTSGGLLAAPQEFAEAEEFRFEQYGFGDSLGLDAGSYGEDATAFMRMGSEETSEAMLQDRSASESSTEFEASNFLGPRRGGLQRQQTAPPTAAFSKDDDNIMLRIKGTFMEAVRIDEDIPQVSMHRSWSDGDLAQLCEAIESESEAESE
eukprot:s4878_g6.t3